MFVLRGVNECLRILVRIYRIFLLLLKLFSFIVFKVLVPLIQVVPILVEKVEVIVLLNCFGVQSSYRIPINLIHGQLRERALINAHYVY